MRRLLLAFFVLLDATAFSSEPVAIQYRLREPGRISLAIYDKDGIQVRTLRNAEPQTASRHSIAWDGLDQDGNPVAPGTYTWKLLQGQGLKAEYLFSFGVSTRELPWPGNHAGPTGVAIEGSNVIVAATAAEGCAQLVKMDLAGNIGAAAAYGWSIEDIAHADKLLYLVSTEMGHLAIVNAATAEIAWWTSLNGVISHGASTIATVKSVERPVAATVDRNVHIFRYDVPHNDGWNWYLGQVTLSNTQARAIQVKLSESMSYGRPNPFKDLTLKPNETVTVDLGKVVVYQDTAEQFVLGVEGEDGWEVQRLDIMAAADRVAACPEQVPEGQKPEPVVSRATPPWANSRNQVWVGNIRAERIQQVDPNMDGKVLREVPVPGFQDLAFTRDGQLLVISGRTVCALRGEKLEPVLRDLDDPRRLAVDEATGDLFIVEWGMHHQVRRYNSAYQLQRVFGREGGRRYGLYQPEDFYRVDDVAGDGHGGFMVVENWGARRTARFDAQGKLVREWYGGQGFQQYVTQDPRHPDRFWLAGMFNTDVIEGEVNWARRDWHVRAVYDAQGAAEKAFGAMGGYGANRFHAAYRDLDSDGKAERLLWLEGGPGILYRVDEAAGRLVPLAAAGFLQDKQLHILMDGKPTAAEAQAYATLLAVYAKHPKNLPAPRYWTWADADGDGHMQAEELRLFNGDYRNGVYLGGYFGATKLGDDLSLVQRTGWGIAPDQPSWIVLKPEGYTKCGAPMWNYTTRTGSIATGLVAQARINDDGSSYEVRMTQGEGYTANGVSGTGGHGFSWPANLDGGTEVLRRGPDGRVRWRSGNHAPVEKNDPGQLHSPLRIAGLVHDCVGVADHIGNPLAVWTTDGLYVGDLFDRRADDGLPGMVYCWFEYRGPIPAGKDRGQYFDHWALNQYDMVSAGLLSLAPNGDAFYMGCGLNNSPIYRVTGWKELKRQQGRIVIGQPVTKPAETGTGLAATYYPLPEFKGEPVRRTDGQVWFGVKSSFAKKPWPLPEITSNACSAVWEGSVQPRFTEPGRLLVYLDLSAQDQKAPPPQRMRLWVNGKVELDYWEHRDFRAVHLQTRQLDWHAGERVSVRLEYSCSQPADELSLCWESPSVEVQHVPAGCLYPMQAATAESRGQ